MRLSAQTWAVIGGLLAAALAATPAAARPGPRLHCTDAIVVADIVRQSMWPLSPSASAFVMRWPWLIEIEVHRTLEGEVEPGRVTVLALLHGSLAATGPHTLHLRRNRLGTFNVVASDTPRCRRGSAPANAYVQPTDGRTLADLIRHAEAEAAR